MAPNMIAAGLVLMQLLAGGMAQRLCIPFTLPTGFDLATCGSAITTALSLTAGTVTCVVGGSASACSALIQAGQADLTKLGGDEMFVANADYGLVAIVSESYSSSNTGSAAAPNYYSVAVVKTATCAALTTTGLTSLKGLSSCHTGYRKTAGWALPVGYMISAGIMPVVNNNPNVQADALSVSSFFGNVCAPRTTADGPTIGGSRYDPLCVGCQQGGGDCTDTSMTAEPYGDYAGAFRCMMEDASTAGKVAFVKHTTPSEYSRDGSKPQSWSTLDQSAFRLVCPGTTNCVTVDQWASCNIAQAAAQAFMSTPAFVTSTAGAALINALVNSNAAAITTLKSVEDRTDFPLSASTVDLRRVANPSTFSDHFGVSALAAFKAIRDLDQGPTVRMCVPFVPTSANYASTCASAMNTALGSSAFTVTCIIGGSAETCAALVAAGGADVTKLGGDEMFVANADNGLVAIVSESYTAGSSDPAPNYYSVAVVKTATCNALTGSKSLASLAGLSSCHTGYRKTAGWVLPMGYMLSQGIMPSVTDDASVQSDAQSVSAFFGNVCAPRTTADGPALGGTRYDPLCAGCAPGGGDCSDTSMTAEPYGDYAGAFRCMMEDAGQVAFIKHTTASEYAQGGSKNQTWSALPTSAFRLVCPSGNSCVTVDNWASCNIATAAAQAFLSTTTFAASSLGASFITAMAAANSAAVTTMKVVGGQANFPLSASTVGCLRVANPSDFAEHFGANALRAFQAIRDLETTAGPTVRLCVPFTPTVSNYAQTCASAINGAVQSKDFSVTCIIGGSAEVCAALVAAGGADVTKLGGDEMFVANADNGLVAIVSESYSSSNTGSAAAPNYYSVAVVKTATCAALATNGLAALKGLSSCHTGYRKTAGWALPVGFMISAGIMPVVDTDSRVRTDAQSVSSFFGNVCAPRTTADGPTIGGSRYDPLCVGCQQGGGDCTDTSMTAEPYGDYAGAFRCMMEDTSAAGKVAFVKHTTPSEYSRDGSKPQSWSTLDQSAFRLVCPGTTSCVTVDQWASCNIAQAAAQAFLSTPTFAPGVRGQQFIAAMVAASARPASITAMKTVEGQANFPLSASTVDLRRVTTPLVFSEHFGASAIAAFQAMRDLEEVQALGSSGAGGGNSNPVSAGGAVGIAFGCAVAGALIALVIVLIVKRRRDSSWKSYETGSAANTNAVPLSKDAMNGV